MIAFHERSPGMRVFDTWFGGSSRRTHRPLKIELLEDRSVPTAPGSTLTITGGGGAFNRLSLNLDPTATQLVLSEFGHVVSSFDARAVKQIVINATALNNNITIGAAITQPATIQGGLGDNVLQAGGGPTNLIAGPGTNRLYAGGAGSLVTATQGQNTIYGGSGSDTVLSGGTGRNIIFGDPNLETVLNLNPGVDHDFRADPPPAPDPSAVLNLPPAPDTTLSASDVNALLQRAAGATASDNAIVAVVDRSGRILGVRVEAGVDPAITGNIAKEVFAIDGAVALARTGAFFGNDQAPLTSRTIQFISQSTVTQREVESDPSILDPNSMVAGPGFVAPIGIGGHFPPGVADTPQVDLFGIENTNRDTTAHTSVAAGGTGQRFNVPTVDIPANIIASNEELVAPDSYGAISGLEPAANPRGIATLPGGIPIYKVVPGTSTSVVVGGIGVYFPGKTGFADEENSQLGSNYNPNKPDLSLQAEYIAFAALGGEPTLGLGVGTLGGVALPPGVGILPLQPDNRIDLVGITLPLFGPDDGNGPTELFNYGQALGVGDPNSQSAATANQPLQSPAGFKNGTEVPQGWLVTPHAGPGGLNADDVTRIIAQGVVQAQQTRAAIRLPLDSLTSMTFAVSDRLTGEVLGLYRMPDSTVFSIDVAVAKSRNVAYYADPTQLQPEDQTDDVQPGVAFSNRTFRFLAEPFYPEGIDGNPPGQFSILTDGGTNPVTGLNTGAPLPASAFTSVFGHDAFNPQTNFHDPNNPLNQNGIVFFPGSVPLYRSGVLSGGLGVSGDGVDQDDVVTFAAKSGFLTPPDVLTADQVFSRDVRLPYQKFNRQPLEPQ
jgi:uncharacterized protein GlcG (DUF336 family)